MWRPPGPRGARGFPRYDPHAARGRGNREKSPPPLCPYRLVASWRRCGTAASRRSRRGSCRGHHRGAADARSGRGRRATAVTRWPLSDKAPQQVWAALGGRRRVPVPDLHDVPANCWPTAPPNSRSAAPADRPRRPRLVKGVQARGVPAGRPRGDQKPRAAALLQRQPLQRSEPAADPRSHLLSFRLPDAAAVHRACTTPAWSPTTAATCCASASGLPRPRGRRNGGDADRGRAPSRTAAEPPLPFLDNYLAA